MAEEQDEALREEEYRTALNQAGPGAGSVRTASGAILNGIMPGEASPGTLESGEAMVGAAGLPLPTANPFHSERIRTEVELIRTRPATLDADARRLQTDPDGPNLGEPGAWIWSRIMLLFWAEKRAVRKPPG